MRGNARASGKRRVAMPPVRRVFTDPVHFLAFGFGLGRIPVAPGTFGTLSALPLILLSAGWPFWAQFGLVVAVSALGLWLCGESARRLDSHDHPGIVWDELAGWLLTMLFVPVSLFTILLGFLLFRFFDIVKPWPVSWLERKIGGGTGIMIDDLAAGVLAGLALYGAELGRLHWFN